MAQPTNQNLRLADDEAFETGEAVSLPDGQYRAAIISAHGEQTPQGYRYFQLAIKPEGEEIELRYGCPLPAGKPVTPASKLGKLLMAFGQPVGPGQTYTIGQLREIMEGKNVLVMVQNETIPNKGTFATIVENSIKPAPALKSKKE